jgi:hypothetical protein
MAISFPNNPSLNDTFTSGGITFTWNGTNWVSSKNTTVLSDTTPQLGGNLDLNSQDITGTGDINVTGTITATSFSGDGSSLTGAGTTTTAEWTLGADGSNHYTFTGPGVADGATDPTIYLTRGQTYKFKNRSGGHPFRIQTSFQNTGGTAYNDGITNNAAGNGEDLYWEVRNDTPDTLYYQCTSHTNMSGRINMISGESKVVGLTSTTATARDAGISTATGSIIYIPDDGMQVYSGDDGGWKTIDGTSTEGGGIAAAGGNSSFTADGKTVQKFTADGTFSVSSGTGTVEIFAVGGGGAGAADSGGGGGGGAAIWVQSVPVSPGSYSVVCGPGGSSGSPYFGPSTPEANHASSYSGNPSYFVHPGGNYIAHGGNAGGTSRPSPYAQSPLSDGRIDSCLGCTGGAHKGSPHVGGVTNAGILNPYPVPGTGSMNVFRNAGGNVTPSNSPWCGAGGGGAGGAGGPVTGGGVAGAGGAGYNAGANIPWMPASEGASGIFGGGGGAGSPDGGPNGGGAGGPGGGGAGSSEGTSVGGHGSDSCGAGGGGADGAPNSGGAGSRGVVYVAYTQLT